MAAPTAVEDALRAVPQDTLALVVERSRVAGNEAFKDGRYKGARHGPTLVIAPPPHPSCTAHPRWSNVRGSLTLT